MTQRRHVASGQGKAISRPTANIIDPPHALWGRLLSGSQRMPVLGGRLVLVTLSLSLGLLAAHGYALFLMAACLICGIVVWAAPRRVAVPVIMLGVVLIPTGTFGPGRIHGIPPTTALAFVTVCAALALWWHRRERGASAPLSGYALASLLILIVASLLQLGISKYAVTRPLYQLPFLWISGLLLGSLLAADLRIADRIGLLALPLAMLAIIESVIGKPTLWSDLIGANEFDNVSTIGGADRAASTFGHPAVAGTALVILAFVVLSRRGPRRAILFSIIVAGAVATVSRGALVGLAAGLLTHFIGKHHQRSQMIGAIAVTAIVGWLLISLVPAFHASFERRVLGASLQSEGIRLNSLSDLRASFVRNDQELWLGRGLGGSEIYLGQTGGNLGWGTYDNQYVTSLYDSGLLVVLAVIGLIVLGVIRARPRARLLAPLVASAVTMYFFEALYWPVTGLLFWMTVGLATTPASFRASGVPVRKSV